MLSRYLAAVLPGCGVLPRSCRASREGLTSFYWSRHALPFILRMWAADLIDGRFFREAGLTLERSELRR